MGLLNETPDPAECMRSCNILSSYRITTYVSFEFWRISKPLAFNVSICDYSVPAVYHTIEGINQAGLRTQEIQRPGFSVMSRLVYFLSENEVELF